MTFVAVTVYVVVDDGLSENDELVEPVFQVYVLAPFAINVVVEPAHIVEEFTVIVGKGVTETFAIAVFVQPNVVPVTV